MKKIVLVGLLTLSLNSSLATARNVEASPITTSLIKQAGGWELTDQQCTFLRHHKYGFQRKCAFALARLGTDESRIALEEMVRSEAPYLQMAGEEGLRHWPCPYAVE